MTKTSSTQTDSTAQAEATAPAEAPTQTTPTHTLIAASGADLIAEVPLEADNLRIGRIFKGSGATVIKLTFDAGQHMKEHSASAPILVQVLDGEIDFEVGGETYVMPQGAIIHVDAKVPHSLTARTVSHALLVLCDGTPTRAPRRRSAALAAEANPAAEQETADDSKNADDSKAVADPNFAADPALVLPITERNQAAPGDAHAHAASQCECGVVDEPVFPELDVRPIPHAIRHATVFGALDSIGQGQGGGMILTAHHDPLPLLAQIEARSPGKFVVDYLDRGPEAWRLVFTAV